MSYKFRLSSIQKLIVFSTIFFILSLRAIRYLFLKNISVIVDNGNYFDTNSVFAFLFFLVSISVFVASVIGFIKIIRRIYIASKNIIVRERFVAFILNCFFTFLISFFVAIILKVLIWP